jgi:hypothetical protein
MPDPEHHSDAKATERLLMWPLSEQLFAIVLFVCLGPGACGVWLLRHGHWVAGIAITALWGFLFFHLVRARHARKTVRLLVSIPCTAVVLAAALLV